MEMDLYSACPCGSGKKIKFCCPREHVTDYLKVFELIEAEQFAAASELADRLVAKAPRQICFLALKATFLDPSDEAATRQMAEQLQAVAAQHPITHAAQAVVALHADDLNSSIEHVQDCIERLENAVPSLLLTAMSMLAGAAMRAGKHLMAFAHASYVLTLTKGRHSASSTLIEHLQVDTSQPPVVRDAWLSRLEHGLGGKLDARLAGLVRRGKWRQARREAQAMLQRQPDSVGAHGILALVNAYLNNEEAAEQEWQRLADSPEVPDALGADACLMVQCMSRERSQMLRPFVHQTYTITNSDTAMERLLSDRRIADSKEDPSAYGDEEHPAPKALFLVLASERPAYREGMTPAELPRVIGEMQLYGRQTDREARIEIAFAANDLPQAKATLHEVLGDALADDAKAASDEPGTTFGYIGLLTYQLLPRRYFPSEIQPDQRLSFEFAELDSAIRERFADVPNPLLGGKTPRECIGDPQQQRRLTAAIVWLETTAPFDSWTGDWNAVWSMFQLERSIAWDVEAGPTACGLAQLVRVDPTKLRDIELLGVFQLATEQVLRHAVRRLAEEVVRRPAARKEGDLNTVYELLVGTSRTPPTRLHWIEQAVQWCRERSLPHGRWLVEQATWQMFNGKHEAAQETLNRVMTHHKNEPGVLEDVYNLLLQLGMITPDGQPVMPPGDEVATEAAAAGKLWTPEQGSPQGSAPQSTSKLWVPGMD